MLKIALFIVFCFAVNFFVGVYYMVSPEIQIDAALDQLDNTESGAIAMRGLEQAVNTPIAFIVIFIGFIVIFRDECKCLYVKIRTKIRGKEL